MNWIKLYLKEINGNLAACCCRCTALKIYIDPGGRRSVFETLNTSAEIYFLYLTF